jgi:mannose-6-phosphate isomerase
MARQVLAIRKALSIQAHPDKKLAQKLHAERPDVYKGERSVCRAHLIEPT